MLSRFAYVPINTPMREHVRLAQSRSCPEEAVGSCYFDILGAARGVDWPACEEVAYKSQDERPSVDLVPEHLMSCGMSHTAHTIAPVATGDGSKSKTTVEYMGVEVIRTYSSKNDLDQSVYRHQLWPDECRVEY